MQLTKFSDYGMRILMQLHSEAPQSCTASKIAANFKISEHHVSKVASALVRGGFIHSSRGRYGGLTLARDANDISVGAVLRHLCADIPVVECFQDNNPKCKIFEGCGLRTPLYQAQQAFFKALDGYSLADIAQNKTLIKNLLSA